MATGTVSSLGVGSGLELQSILDQLREVDETLINYKKNDVAELESKLNEFTVVNNKLLTLKSSALDLSLSSNFLSRTTTSSDESVFTATALEGTPVQTTPVTVDRLATKSAWGSAGADSSTASVYVPVSQESTTGVADAAVTSVVSTDGTLVIEYGETPDTISVDVGSVAGVTTMNELRDAINNDAENTGLVTASTYDVDGETFLRIESSTVDASGEAHRVNLTTNDTDLAFEPPTMEFTYKMGSTVYVPTSKDSINGVDDAAVTEIASTDGTFVIEYGDVPSTITVDVGTTAGVTTMDQLVDAINNDAENTGLVTAATFDVSGSTYLRINSATPDASGEAHRVAITTNDTTLDFEQDFTTVTLDVAADTTMAQLVDQINDDTNNPGVTASVINDGTTNPYRLVLQADNVGSDFQILMDTQLPDLTMTNEGEEGANLNAQVTIDGVSYQRQANIIDDVMTSITLNLQSAGTSTVTVASNKEDIQAMVVDMVTAYNEAIQEIDSNTGYNEETDSFGLLARSTIRDLPFALNGLMTSINEADSEGLVTSLFDLGMEFERDGTITLDESVLSAAISGHPEGVQDFFLGDSDNDIEGFADKVNDYLRELTGGTGQIAAEKTSAQIRIDDLNDGIEAQVGRLNKKYDLLAQRFVALDQYMNQMTSISSFLTGQFDALSSGWGKVGSGDK